MVVVTESGHIIFPDLGGFVACFASGQCFVWLVVLLHRGEDRLVSFRRHCCYVEIDVGFITIVCGYNWFCLSRLCEKERGVYAWPEVWRQVQSFYLSGSSVFWTITGVCSPLVLLLESIH